MSDDEEPRFHGGQCACSDCMSYDLTETAAPLVCVPPGERQPR